MRAYKYKYINIGTHLSLFPVFFALTALNAKVGGTLGLRGDLVRRRGRCRLWPFWLFDVGVCGYHHYCYYILLKLLRKFIGFFKLLLLLMLLYGAI